jgi:type I restriction enzyme S subunit
VKHLTYQKYKNSGIDWIGDLPVDWGVSKIKYLGNSYTGNSLNEAEKSFYESEDESHIPYISSKDIDLNTKVINYKNGLRIPPDNLEFKKAPKGSFLICIEGGSAGKKIARLNQDVNFVNKLCCIDAINSDFLYYFFQSLNFSDKFNLSMTGLIGGVSISTLKNFDIPTPPHDEQLKIVSFLDRETTEIDGLIQKQEKLIELLNEKKKSVISDFLLRGINKNEELIDSGSEILGLIPKRWGKRRLKYFLSLNPSYKENTNFDISTPTPFFAMEAIGDDGSLNGEVEHPFGDICNSYTYFRNNDVVVAKVTPCFENGKGALINGLEVGFGFGTTELAVLRPMEALDSEYLYYITISREIREYGTAFMTGAGGLKRVPDDFYLNLVWPLPPIKEQLEIIKKLKEILFKINILIKKSKDSVEYLKEHRTSLISAAVTGKIMVTE